MAEPKFDLGWMRIFQEVGRTGNLTLAAGRLGLSQPAVSYQIRRIEEQLQVSLLQRQHRGVALMAEGRRLMETVSRTVADLDALAKSFRHRPQRPAIRLKTDYALSSLWLMPRMHAFRKSHPDMDIQIVATHRTDHDRSEEGEVAVVFGTLSEFGRIGTLLMPERVAPVCAPGFLAANGPLDDASQIAGATLLHLDAQGPSPWYDWASYLKDLGVRNAQAAGQGELRFNTYSLVVQAAIAEQGMAIGWLGLLDQLLTTGLLVQAGPVLTSLERGYWILPPAERKPETDQLCAWLMSELGGAETG
ncbi:LysR family transcriptional regulator [Rhizobium sp. 0TCS1.26]|uniref:choline sulfate utilization transcriptional regulator n=1 Tax=Rhizobium sp. 0TCS1.26 TaxID=3142623 RepID=UPI003D2A963B